MRFPMWKLVCSRRAFKSSLLSEKLSVKLNDFQRGQSVTSWQRFVDFVTTKFALTALTLCDGETSL